MQDARALQNDVMRALSNGDAAEAQRILDSPAADVLARVNPNTLSILERFVRSTESASSRSAQAKANLEARNTRRQTSQAALEAAQQAFFAGGSANVCNAPGSLPELAPNTPCTHSSGNRGLEIMHTYESASLWLRGAGSGNTEVHYRAQGDTLWNEALPLWYDARTGEHKGSLVNLRPGTQYEIQVMRGGTKYCGSITTKSNSYPVGRVTNLGSRRGDVNITQGGTPDAYHVIEGDTITGGTYGLYIDAPYVVIRGMTIKDATMNGIRLGPNAHHVIIENNEITNWGSISNNGWPNNEQGGILGRGGNHNITIQNNEIHTPRIGANTWNENSHRCQTPPESRCHPYGPQAIQLKGGGAANQHSNVIRYNRMYSKDPNILFNDIIGGDCNGCDYGFPGRNSDVYGNFGSNYADDGFEIEGGGENVRVWGNKIVGFQPPNRPRAAYSALGFSYVRRGPMYAWNNILDRSERGGFAIKSQTRNSSSSDLDGVGATYFLHNTVKNWSSGYNSLNSQNQGLENSITRNNIWQTGGMSIDGRNLQNGNSFDYDLYSGNSPGQQNGIKGTASFTGDGYDLAPNSRGVDAGVRIPGFNDCFEGSAPDMGAREFGAN